MITICQNCKAEFTIEPQHLGITTVCQKCAKPFVVRDGELAPELPVPSIPAAGGPQTAVSSGPGDSADRGALFGSVAFIALIIPLGVATLAMADFSFFGWGYHVFANLTVMLFTLTVVAVLIALAGVWHQLGKILRNIDATGPK